MSEFGPKMSIRHCQTFDSSTKKATNKKNRPRAFGRNSGSKYMQIRFYLKNYVSKDGTRAIWLQYSHANQRIRIPTGERIDPKFWNPKRQEARSGWPGYVVTNRIISDFKQKVLRVVSEIKLDGKEPLVVYCIPFPPFFFAFDKPLFYICNPHKAHL